jgi:hypothetical protein
MLNYQNRTLTPILTAICEEMTRKFLTQTARSQGQRIKFMQSPFKLVPVSQIADIADKFTRSEILSSNELRAIVGFKPVDDPKADELRNSNLNESADAPPPASTNDEVGTSEERHIERTSDQSGTSSESIPKEVLDFIKRFQNSK